MGRKTGARRPTRRRTGDTTEEVVPNVGKHVQVNGSRLRSCRKGRVRVVGDGGGGGADVELDACLCRYMSVDAPNLGGRTLGSQTLGVSATLDLNIQMDGGRKNGAFLQHARTRPSFEELTVGAGCVLTRTCMTRSTRNIDHLAVGCNCEISVVC